MQREKERDTKQRREEIRKRERGGMHWRIREDEGIERKKKNREEGE